MFNGHSNLVLSVFNLYLYSYPKVVLCHDYSARRLVPLYKRQAAAPQPRARAPHQPLRITQPLKNTQKSQATADCLRT
jgi:hypothetical protein